MLLARPRRAPPRDQPGGLAVPPGADRAGRAPRPSYGRPQPLWSRGSRAPLIARGLVRAQEQDRRGDLLGRRPGRVPGRRGGIPLVLLVDRADRHQVDGHPAAGDLAGERPQERVLGRLRDGVAGRLRGRLEGRAGADGSDPAPARDRPSPGTVAWTRLSVVHRCWSSIVRSARPDRDRRRRCRRSSRRPGGGRRRPGRSGRSTDSTAARASAASRRSPTPGAQRSAARPRSWATPVSRSRSVPTRPSRAPAAANRPTTTRPRTPVAPRDQDNPIGDGHRAVSRLAGRRRDRQPVVERIGMAAVVGPDDLELAAQAGQLARAAARARPRSGVPAGAPSAVAACCRTNRPATAIEGARSAARSRRSRPARRPTITLSMSTVLCPARPP